MRINPKTLRPPQSTGKRFEAPSAQASSSRRNLPSTARRRQPDTFADAGPMGSETVMVINPVGLDRKAMVEAIRPFGFRVLEAESVVEAQRKVKRHPDIRLLIVDLSALELDEVQTALWFHGMYPQLKVLVASTWIWNLNYQLGESEQIAFCPKPFTALDLARMVRRTLN